jgi:hypothetical protein
MSLWGWAAPGCVGCVGGDVERLRGSTGERGNFAAERLSSSARRVSSDIEKVARVD